MTASIAEPLPPRAARITWIAAVAAVLASCLVSSQCGCAHTPPPAHVEIPTAAAVQTRVGAPAEAARKSNSRAMQLAAKAEQVGIAAGSADARTLVLATAESDRHLREILNGKDLLTRQLGEVRLETAALEKDRDTKAREVIVEKARGDREETLHHRWRDYAVGGLILVGVAISLAGAKLQELFDAAEKFALKEGEAVIGAFGRWLMKIPAVMKYVGVALKIGAALLAFL